MATVAAFLALCADSPAAMPAQSCAGGDDDTSEATAELGCSIGGTQFEDSNDNGRRDAGEPGLAGWAVYADFDGDGQRGPAEPSAISAADGRYEIAVPYELATAAFALNEELEPGWACTTPAAVCSYAEQPFIDSDPDQEPELARGGRDFGAVATVAAAYLPPASAKVLPGFARLSAGSACPSRYTRMSVRGRAVANVSYFLDSQKLMTVIRPDSRGRFAYRIRTARMTPGVHRIRAQVTYKAASATASMTLSAAVHRCRPARPRFAG